jgi:hypothetical protein
MCIMLIYTQPQFTGMNPVKEKENVGRVMLFTEIPRLWHASGDTRLIPSPR